MMAGLVGVRNWTSEYQISVLLPLAQGQVWQSLVDPQQRYRWLPEGTGLRQLDDGEIGRGSELQLDWGGHLVNATVTYWDPPVRATLRRRWWPESLEYHLLLEPQPKGTLLDLRVSAAAGVAGWLATPLMWLEKRRLSRWMAGLPRRYAGTPGKKDLLTTDNRETV